MKAWGGLHVLSTAPVTAVLRLVMLLLLLLAASSASASFHADDAEDDDYSSLPSDEGSGPDDEDFSYLFTDVTESDVTFRCYRCTGITELSGCNVTSLYENPADYVTDCDGHCLNISTAESTVFDCTDKVPLRSARCFQKDGILMCVCKTDLCNGPPLPPAAPEDAVPLPTSPRYTNLTTSLPQGNVTHLGVKPQTVKNTSEPQAPNVTSRNVDVKPRVINLTSEQGIKLTSQVEMTPQQFNITSGLRENVSSPDDAPRSGLNMTSRRLNMTSPQDNSSSEKAGVVTSQRSGGGGGRKAISPETFKQRHLQNGTVIEAASTSGSEPVTQCGCVTCMVLVLLWRCVGDYDTAGLHS